MKKLFLLPATFLIFSCNQTQEKNHEATPNSTEEMIKEPSLKSQPSFAETLKKLSKETNMIIVDTFHGFSESPYVICFMQAHNLDSTTKNLYARKDRSDEMVKKVQAEMLNSIMNLTDFPIHYEGFMRESGRITSKATLSPSVMSNPSSLDQYVANNLDAIVLYGIESWEIHGKVNALMALRDHYLKSIKFFNTLTSEEDKKQFIRKFVMGFELFFNKKELNIREIYRGEYLDEKFLTAYEKQITTIVGDVIAMRSKVTDNPEGWMQVFMELDKYIITREYDLYMRDRNYDIVTGLPTTVNIILVLGNGHFKAELNHKSNKGPFVEDLLRQKKLNYIILKPKSLNMN